MRCCVPSPFGDPSPLCPSVAVARLALRRGCVRMPSASRPFPLAVCRAVGLSVALYAVRMSVYAVPCVPSVLMGLYAVHGACEGNAGACAVPLPLRPLLCRQ